MKKVSVVILNWNGLKLLKEFLPSVREFTDLSIADVVIADNGSEDDSLDYVKSNFPEFKVFAMKENHGFAEGYNIAIENIDTEYSVLLNSDVRVTKNWLEPLVAYADENIDVAAIQPKILSLREPGKFEHAGACGGFLDKYGYPFCRGRIFDTLEKDNNQYDTIEDVFWASGACFFTRTELYKKAGGLDRNFFAHMEEIDLCWRYHLLGFRIVCVPQSAVYHLGGATLDADNPRKTYLNFRNNILMLYKNLPSKGRKRKLLCRKLLDGLAALNFLLQGKKDNFKAVYNAHIDSDTLIKNIYSKENKEALTDIMDGSLHTNRSIVFDYYLKKKKHYSDL